MGTLSPVVCTPQQQWQSASIGRVRVSAGAPTPVAASFGPASYGSGSSVPATGSRPLHGSQQIDALDHPRPRTSAAVT